MLKKVSLTVFILTILLLNSFIWASTCEYPFWLEGKWNGRDTILLHASFDRFAYGNIDLNKEKMSEKTTGLIYQVTTKNETLIIRRISNECIRIIVINKYGAKKSGIFYKF